ncbi:hypothetical protein [Neisseria sicca]|nr:hypothetical protein [Neisseria sicca]
MNEWFGVRIFDFQTTLLCLILRGRGQSPRYFFSVFFRGRAVVV